MIGWNERKLQILEYVYEMGEVASSDAAEDLGLVWGLNFNPNPNISFLILSLSFSLSFSLSELRTTPHVSRISLYIASRVSCISHKTCEN